MEEMKRTYECESTKPSTKLSKLFNASSLNHPLNRYSNATPSQATSKTGVPIATLLHRKKLVRTPSRVVRKSQKDKTVHKIGR